MTGLGTGWSTRCGRLALLLVGVVCAAAAETNETQSAKTFERYQVIVEKNPFGRMMAEGEVVLPDFAKNLRLCALARFPDPAQPGRMLARAGFVGPAPTNQFTVLEGELTEEGYSLEEVNYADQKVKLRKGTEVATLTVEGLPVPLSAMGSSSPQLQAVLQSPHAWRMMHDAQRGPNGEIVPAHLHMPGGPEGANNRAYLSDAQAQELRRQRDMFSGRPPLPPGR
jgi:hypothetical protein